MGILPLHRRSTRSRSLDGATVVGKPPLLLRTHVLRKVASLSLANFNCRLAVLYDRGVIIDLYPIPPDTGYFGTVPRRC